MVTTGSKTSLLGRLGRMFRFGYDAAENGKGRRRSTGRLTSEDRELPREKRRNVISRARDVSRNFAIARWAIGKHLDFVTRFRFQCRTDDETVNERVEQFMRWCSLKENCDAARRHPLRRMLRLAEARRAVDGDVFLTKLATGQLQAIEGDRVRSPLGRRNLVHGVQLDSAGGALAYAVCRRTRGSGFKFERMVPASNVFHHAYYDRFDQTRGIGLITPALNDFTDVYEGIDLAKARAKASQLFGLVTKLNDDRQLGEEDEETGKSELKVDFDGGPLHLNLYADEEASFLENKTPSVEFQQFLQAVILAALKSLDIPYSFYDESFTNFYGSRGGLIQYLQACKAKREDNAELLDEYTDWRLRLGVARGEIELPRGWRVVDLQTEWIHDGVPWWNPTQEAKGHLLAIAAGLTTPQRVCQETGTDYYENIDAIEKAITYAGKRGVPLSFVPAPQKTAV